MKRFIPVFFLFFNCCIFSCRSGAQSFEQFKDNFIKGYTALNLPEYVYDYRTYFSNIPTIETIQAQKDFLTKAEQNVKSVSVNPITTKQKADLKIIIYEIQFNLQRLQLEEEWVNGGRKIPLGGLYTLPHHEAWYQYFIQKFTSTRITPQQVFEMGKKEVTRVKKEIDSIRLALGYKDEATLYEHLTDARFFLTDKMEIIRRFKSIDSTVREHLSVFTDNTNIPPVYPMEWPDAGPATPPGMYLNHYNNAYGKDVFQFNFYGGRYNYRVMDWIYMHEAIPGHHLQASVRPVNPLQELFLYPGNFEGWGCYVEYYGKELGLYADPYTELGKWEWDLVRSLRLVLDAGIHFYGWSKEEALHYWKENIQGQDDIAEREVNRVTNWTAQALSYKVGAAFIFNLQQSWLLKNPSGSLKDFRRQYLAAGMAPLIVIEDIL